MSKRVCVIGGGISGLCAAYHLRSAGADVVLFERGTSAGGNIKTEIRDGFLIEHGPNTALANRELIDLVGDLGISDQIAQPDRNASKRYILKDGQLVALPSGILDLIAGETFSTGAKLRLLKEPFVCRNASAEESVAEFFERRLGKELVEYAVDPFISGIHAGDPDKLSIRHAFPRLFQLERDYGSLSKGAIFSRKDRSSRVPKGTPRSITFKSGMHALTDALAERLGESIRLNKTASAIRRSVSGGFIVEATGDIETFGAVVVCTPAYAAARLVEPLDYELASELQGVYYSPVSVAFTAYRREQVHTDPDGFGFLVPSIERRRILGSLWTSSVFENRAPDGYHLFTTFIGGSRNAQLCDQSDDELVRIAHEELSSILGIDGEPVFSMVRKWDRAIPQYNIGYEKVLDSIDKFKTEHKGLFFCSNFLNGISVGDCVKSSAVTARGLMEL